MTLVLFGAVAAVVMILGDLVMIPNVMRPLFQAALADQMLDSLRLGPAALFYVIHLAGLIWFAGVPLLRGGSARGACLNGAFLGFVAYACYEMTSWTIMRDWTARLVVMDLAWGTVLSGAAAGMAGWTVRRWASRA
jgi:uncharacterized membrane protein